MMSDHSEEHPLEHGEINRTASYNQEEEEQQQRENSPTISEYGMETNEPDLVSYSKSDDDDEILHQSTPDHATDDNQSSVFNEKQMAIVLALFRHRHNLSKSCINDLCDLLRNLGVQNVPSDFRSIERCIIPKQEKILHSKRYIVCSLCGNKGSNPSKCENAQCKFSSDSNSNFTTLFTFKLLPQITSILERHNIIPESNNDSTIISDVLEGQLHRDLISHERACDPGKQIITLLLNSDGVIIKKISRSVWVTCMIINELPRAIRFNINNVIICSISMGNNKPKKDQFQSFMFDWIHELRQLELGFHICPPNSDNEFVKFHAYLIAAAADKPAQSLLMNLIDPVGFYSCVRCTIRGKTQILDYC